MCAIKHRLRKYLIMGSQDCHRDPKDILTEAIAAGITAFQYREKGPGSLRGDHQVELGRQLRKACYKHDILFIVNDDVHLAKLLDADGLHIGQNDISVEKARTLFPNKIIGLSVSNTTEVDQSPMHLVDYIGAGPIFKTATKPDKKPVGIQWIKTLRAEFPTIPIVGIGGINIVNATSVIHAGADGVACITAVTQGDPIKEVVAQL